MIFLAQLKQDWYAARGTWMTRQQDHHDLFISLDPGQEMLPFLAGHLAQ